MLEPRKPRVALLGPLAERLGAQLEAAGFEIDDAPGAAAVASSSELVAQARRVYSPVVGIADEGPAPDGADAIVRAAHAAIDLPPLLRALTRASAERDDLAAIVEDALSGGEPEPLLAQVVTRIASRLTVERCSMLLIGADGSGTVVAASDEPEARGRQVDLALYPEIREVIITRAALIIDDAQGHPLLDPVRGRIEEQGISAIAVIPMACDGEMVGVVFIRSRTRAGFAPREVAFLSTVASAAAAALRNAGRIRSEREQRVAAERELSQLRRYEEFFSHVNDGMAVLDGQGRVLTMNPAGCTVLGIAPEDTRGLLLPDLVAPESAMEANLLWRELSRGGRVLSADLRVLTRDGRKTVLSVSAGPLRSQNGRAILTFRDVSESRELESELRKTKEFLERLIDATPDGIVAADLRGNILLFNKGAERMTGFVASETVGKSTIYDFYPPGQARTIMGRLREAKVSGQEGSAVQCELVAKNGEVVPVMLSVALVAEGGEETATVGVFRDLREELRVEAELQKTRERLEAAEKAAVVSALAGAAAHELNQPLTSVLGFSELLFRRTQVNDRGREELAAILREAERMAGIVKKIGKITRYETTPYIGTKRIVDLEKSSDPPPTTIIIDDKA
ncbi:MAG: PAS domain S-box protein [Myxococcales bacterium]